MAAVASAVTRAISLCSCSSAFGMNSITTMPATGRNTPTGNNQLLAELVR